MCKEHFESSNLDPPKNTLFWRGSNLNISMRFAKNIFNLQIWAPPLHVWYAHRVRKSGKAWWWGHNFVCVCQGQPLACWISLHNVQTTCLYNLQIWAQPKIVMFGGLKSEYVHKFCKEHVRSSTLCFRCAPSMFTLMYFWCRVILIILWLYLRFGCRMTFWL